MSAQNEEKKLPEYDECLDAFAAGVETPLHVFILDNEPAGEQEIEFREQLAALIVYVRQAAIAQDCIESQKREAELRERVKELEEWQSRVRSEQPVLRAYKDLDGSYHLTQPRLRAVSITWLYAHPDTAKESI